MARYVLLSFESNEEADNFIKAVHNHDVIFPTTTVQDSIVYGAISQSTFVRALWAKPTKFCECPNPGAESVRGRKWGWWVHAKCGKPKKEQWQHPTNLIEVISHHRERTTYLGIVEPTRPETLAKLLPYPNYVAEKKNADNQTETGQPL